ncbi:MAG TPA: hypothetical protein VJK54_04125 [Chthoniobacterales bacterium]|nr:hypothetical protein [Chthoniobacterales bacterium]
MNRIIESELLDHLLSTDPDAITSRNDLQRLNFFMGNATILLQAWNRSFNKITLKEGPLQIIELGAGDGTLLLKLARQLQSQSPHKITADVTFIDRHNVISQETIDAFKELHWSIKIVTMDLFLWLEQSPLISADVILANLFLHHFNDQELKTLFQHLALKTNLFLACEPRRNLLALMSSKLLWLLNANTVTQHDAPVSVRAGFTDKELSQHWPAGPEWHLREQCAIPFCHSFIAQRNA